MSNKNYADLIFLLSGGFWVFKYVTDPDFYSIRRTEKDINEPLINIDDDLIDHLFLLYINKEIPVDVAKLEELHPKMIPEIIKQIEYKLIPILKEMTRFKNNLIEEKEVKEVKNYIYYKADTEYDNFRESYHDTLNYVEPCYTHKHRKHI